MKLNTLPNEDSFIFGELLKLTNEIIVLRDDFSDVKNMCRKMRFDDIPEINNKLDKLIDIALELQKAIKEK